MTVFTSIWQAICSLTTIRFTDIIDIALVAYAFYYLIKLIRSTHASRLFMGIIMILGLLWFSGIAQLHTVNFILRNTVQIGMLALVVLFQPEIRRFLERLGKLSSFDGLMAFLMGTKPSYDESVIMQVVFACAEMSRVKEGALIVFERGNSLDEQIRTGTVINADVSSELIRNLFFTNSPLHDGAVIIRDGRIHAAKCILPLSETNIASDLGTRHRAGIGLSEKSDALVVIVSEQTGAISVTVGGVLKRHLTQDTLINILRQNLIGDEEMPNTRPWLRRKDKDHANG